MKVNYELINGIERPRVDIEESPEAEVLNCFLEDAQGSPQLYLDLISRSEKGEEILGSSSNQVGVDFYTDKVLIEHLWSTDSNGQPLYAEISLAEAKELVESLKLYV